MFNLIIGIVLPFLGTTIGSFFVFFLRNKINNKIEKFMLGFAGGVMIAASVWSLIIPSIEQSSHLNQLSFLPAVIGVILGVLFLIFLDKLILGLKEKDQRIIENKGKSKMLVLAVTLHNIPEGMAVGVALAGAINGNAGVTMASALALSIGIAVQNIPEGAIISMPKLSQGVSKTKAFSCGVLSGIVEPIFSILTLFLINIISSILPYLLAFSAGTMIYVVVQELIPEASDERSKVSVISFMIGFLLMMALDVALG